MDLLEGCDCQQGMEPNELVEAFEDEQSQVSNDDVSVLLECGQQLLFSGPKHVDLQLNHVCLSNFV